ncbi:MAG TPA: hypothetical protein PL110_12270 [Candidatus Eremiobacteraeota bacterium]|nr:MAG: hypothetical protein BWY64_03063 [bacterium ADurb.Bin363]HPZ08885.1 hypothetical protein [Candidatus Eremiobacteraeota bacterium]
MNEKKSNPNDMNVSDELRQIIEVFSKTASNITSNIEEAIKVANSEEELVNILKETLKNTKANINNLIEKLEK